MIALKEIIVGGVEMVDIGPALAIIGKAYEGDWWQAKRWIETNASPTLSNTLFLAEQAGLTSALTGFGNWVQTKLEGSEPIESAPQWQQTMELRDAETVATTLAVSEEVSGSASAKNFEQGDDGALTLIESDRRIGVGFAYDPETREKTTVFLAESAAAESDVCKALARLDARSRVVHVNSAYAGQPNGNFSANAAIDFDKWRPGKPVSYFGGSYGSLSLFVGYCDANSNEVKAGFLSASHVLTNLDPNHDIRTASPVPPFVRTHLMRNIVGEVVNYPGIFHYDSANSINKIINNVDIALSSIRNRPNDIGNFVPNPKSSYVACGEKNNYSGLDTSWMSQDPLELVKEFSYADEELKSLFLNNRVFKFGATSGLTFGIVDAVAIRSYRITMPNNRNYLFGEMTLVRSGVEGTPFSVPGDSGAPVYTEDGRIVGTVIGGNDTHTFVGPLHLALSSLEGDNCRVASARELKGYC